MRMRVDTYISLPWVCLLLNESTEPLGEVMVIERENPVSENCESLEKCESPLFTNLI